MAQPPLPRPTEEQLRDVRDGYPHDPFYARELNQRKPCCAPAAEHDWVWWGWEGSFNLDWCKKCNWVAFEGNYRGCQQNIHDLWESLRARPITDTFASKP